MSPIRTSKAFDRFVELMKELQRQHASGEISPAKERRFAEAMKQCRPGMTLAENEFIDRMEQKSRKATSSEIAPETFTIDASKPPYEVQCPVCYANAFSLCRDKPRAGRHRRFPVGARVLSTPHPERWTKWHARPDLRSRAMR